MAKEDRPIVPTLWNTPAVPGEIAPHVAMPPVSPERSRTRWEQARELIADRVRPFQTRLRPKTLKLPVGGVRDWHPFASKRL